VTSPENGNFSGIGMMMESFGNNPVIQDYIMDMIWRDQIPEPESWIKDFVQRRYGSDNPELLKVWKGLLKTVYSSHVQSGSRICDRPGLTNPKLPYRSKPYTQYDPLKLAQTCELFLNQSNELKHQGTYQFDAVNITRQVLSNLSNTFVKQIDTAYYAGNKMDLQKKGQLLLEMITDLDELLSTREEYLLGKWIAEARRWGNSEDESDLYEWNARNLITMWGEKCTEGQFDDLNGYALKQWSGLFKGYYLPRWQKFLGLLTESVDSKKPFVRDGYLAESCAWEKEWSHEHEVYPDKAEGDPVAVSKRLFAKYKSYIFN
jgi:alpha-N-acetylglucosaminidase